MTNEITQEELRSLREQGVNIFDPGKVHINITGKNETGNTIVRYNEEGFGYLTTSGVQISNIIQKLRIKNPEVDKWEYSVFKVEEPLRITSHITIFSFSALFNQEMNIS